MQNKYLKLLLIALIVAFVIPQITLAAWWNPFSWSFWNKIFHKQTSMVACPMITKLCPDGSSVSPQGPKCEFPACPNSTAGWKTYTNTKFGYQIEYPSDAALFNATGVNSIENTDEIDFTPKSSPSSLEISVTSADLLSNPSYSYPQCSRKEYPYVNVIIAEMNFFKSDVSNDYKGMNSRGEIAVEYCILGINGNKYALIIHGAYTPSDTLLKMMNTFKFTNTTTQEQGCINSGGKVVTTTCYCSSTTDFYNNCAIGGCTCTPNPAYARQIKNCDCGQGKCFDGQNCVNLSY